METSIRYIILILSTVVFEGFGQYSLKQSKLN